MAFLPHKMITELVRQIIMGKQIDFCFFCILRQGNLEQDFFQDFGLPLFITYIAFSIAKISIKHYKIEKCTKNTQGLYAFIATVVALWYERCI